MNIGFKEEILDPSKMKLNSLKHYLCSMAYTEYSKEPPRVDMCRMCYSSCKYGERLIVLDEEGKVPHEKSKA